MFYDARSVFHSVAWSLIAFIKAWSLVDLIWTQLWSKNVCLHCTARHWYHVCWPWYDMVSSWWNFVGQRSNMVIELVGQWAGTPNVRPKFMPTFIVRPRSSARYCYSSDVRPSGVCHALIHHTGQAWCSTDSSFWTQKNISVNSQCDPSRRCRQIYVVGSRKWAIVSLIRVRQGLQEKDIFTRQRYLSELSTSVFTIGKWRLLSIPRGTGIPGLVCATQNWSDVHKNGLCPIN